MREMVRQLIKAAERGDFFSPSEFSQWKRTIAKSEGVPLPANRDILREYRKYIKEQGRPASEDVIRFLRIRKVRTLSGIAPIGVHTRPMGCPGKCVYCPSEARMPKSYLSTQPAVMRAIANHFDPGAMIRSRLEQLERNGHATDKNELIVMGGTWSAHPRAYQEAFLQQCFNAFNGGSSENLEMAQRLNETTQHRCVGLTLETRPDWVNEEEVQRWIRYGATRCELGVQSIDSDVLTKIRRGHGVEATIRATELFKQAGFKITYHMMPGLPGSNPEKDVEMFRELFSNSNFQPDQIKIYPCVVNEHAELFQWWKEGKFQPYDDKILLKVLRNIKLSTPPHVRIARLFRDIPGDAIQAGSRLTNIRQIIQDRMRAADEKCQCIRCREPRAKEFAMKEVELKIRRYEASGGAEIFFSYETSNNRMLLAFLRLRLNPTEVMNHHFLSVLRNCAIVRELHTYGELVRLDNAQAKIQHQGFGRRLMRAAEQFALEHGVKKLAVISGVGVREYYRKIGYQLDCGYMIKTLA